METTLIVRLEDETCRSLSLTCAIASERCPQNLGVRGEIEQLTCAEDEEDSLAVVERPNMTVIILTKGL